MQFQFFGTNISKIGNNLLSNYFSSYTVFDTALTSPYTTVCNFEYYNSLKKEIAAYIYNSEFTPFSMYMEKLKQYQKLYMHKNNQKINYKECLKINEGMKAKEQYEKQLTDDYNSLELNCKFSTVYTTYSSENSHHISPRIDEIR